MIFRRLATSLRAQDWFMVVLELLILVVGIFLALQVDAWNQARKDGIDERIFLQSLHEDVLGANALSRRTRQRGIDRRELMLSAGDVLFSRNKRNVLTHDECNSIVWSTAFNIAASGLPSVDELIGTGRMGIIRNAELRTALVALRQARGALETTISEKTATSNVIFLPGAFPSLFQLTLLIDDTLGEVRTGNSCDLAAMRADQSFLNQFTANADVYDAFVRDGLEPWSQQFERVHMLVDIALGIDQHVEVHE